MYSLIIPCAGLSERIKEKYYFDKCLLPVKQSPIIFEIIKSWENYIDEVIIVGNKKNENIIREYLQNFYWGDLNIKYVTSHHGTLYAVSDGLHKASNKDVIVNWCDVCVKQKVHHFLDINKNIVLTTNKIDCRWKFKNGKFEEKSFGEGLDNGIFGIFTLHDISIPSNSCDDQCFDCNEFEIWKYLDPNSFIGITYEEFYDIGDSNKYCLSLRMDDNSTQIRKFNSITMYDNVVVKKTSSSTIKSSEEKWYKENKFSFVPKIYNYNPLVMERLDAKPAFLYLNNENENEILDIIFSVAKEIHTSKDTIECDVDSCWKEYYWKTCNRLRKVDFMFGFKDDFFIDGIRCINPMDIIYKNRNMINRIIPETFHVIHGDLQLSNLLLTPSFDKKVIDPRGYFGNTEIYGDAAYDYAKMFYGFCGMYGVFNSGNNSVVIKEKNNFELIPLLSKEDYKRREELFIKKLKEVDYIKINMDKIHFLHAIIWLSVTEYISNDVLSCLYAYLNGTKILKKAVE